MNLKGNRIKKILLMLSGIISAVFFLLSASSLYTEADILETGFTTPWFTWEVDAVAIYFLTAVLCLITARLAMEVFHKKEQDNYEVLIEG